MIVPINGGGVCASRAIPSVRHICFGVVNSLPPSPSIRSASFGPLHSLSPLGLAIRIHRCSTQTTLTPSFYENKTTTAIAETNKQKRRVRQAIFIHDAFDAPGKFTVRRIRIFPGFKIFFISTEVHNSCFVDLRCFFFFLLDVYHLCRGRLQMLLLWELLFTECSRAWRRDVVLALTAILLCRSAEGTCSSNWRKRKKSSRLALGYFGFLSRASLWLRLDDCSLEAIGEFLYSEHYAVKPKNVIYAEDIYLLYAFLYKDKHYVCL